MRGLLTTCTVFVFLVALYFAFNGVYDNILILRNLITPSLKTVWVIPPVQHDTAFMAGADAAAASFSLKLNRFSGGSAVSAGMSKRFLPYTVIWAAPQVSDTPCIVELQRHMVPVVTVDNDVDGCDRIAVAGEDQPARYRQGVWAVTAACLALTAPIFIKADSKNDSQYKEGAVDSGFREPASNSDVSK